jgi:HDOD domain
VVAPLVRSGKVMFNPQAPVSGHSTRSLVLRQALAAALKARRQSPPPAPASLPLLLDGCTTGISSLITRPGCRDALREIRARLFHAPGRDLEAQAWWHEVVATAVFAARIAQLKQASIPASFLASLLHRSGEALALKILARVEIEHRMRLDSSSRRDWCATHSQDLTERLVRAWNLTPDIGSCVLGWMRFGEFAEVSGESAALYFGRLFAIELLQPDLCVPGAVDHAASEMGLSEALVVEVRGEAGRARELIRVME